MEDNKFNKVRDYVVMEIDRRKQLLTRTSLELKVLEEIRDQMIHINTQPDLVRE